MFSWVTDLFLAFGQLIPRLYHLLPTKGAVRFRRGKARVLRPGYSWWWPVTDEISDLVTARQVTNLETQALTTSDGVELAVSGVVVYDIIDPHAALVKSHEIEEVVANVGLTAVAKVVSGQEFDELSVGHAGGALSRALQETVAQRLCQFGVRVLSCGLTDFCRCRVVKHLGVPGPDTAG